MSHNIFKMSFAKIYLMYIKKVQKKGRTRDELNSVIYWLTGHIEDSLKEMLERDACVGEFFESFPKLNENAGLITGSICGKKIEEIQDPLMKKIRYLDKLVDELAKGKPINKILRKQ